MSKARPGHFLVLEGIDGCGKSSQAKLLIEHLQRRGLTTTHLREPGSTPPGEKVRELLLDPATGQLDPRCETLLFMACRSQLVSTHIQPALARGEVVVCERHHPSSICYQGVGLGLGMSTVEEVANWTTPDLVPDLVLILDIPATTALGRLQRGHDRLEARGEDYLEKVRQGFLSWAKDKPHAKVLDASLSVAEVGANLTREVDLVL